MTADQFVALQSAFFILLLVFSAPAFAIGYLFSVIKEAVW